MEPVRTRGKTNIQWHTPTLTTLGGCNLNHLGTMLQTEVDHTHYWRASVLTLGSPPLHLRNKHLPLPGATQLLVRESEKQLLPALAARRPDCIVLEAAGDAHCRFLRVGSAIVPDLRNPIFGHEWPEAITYEHIPELRDAETLDPDRPDFWPLWLEHLRSFVGLALAARPEARIVVFARSFCTHYLENGRLVAFPDEERISRLNGYLEAVYREAEHIPGVTVLRPDPLTWISSPAAPYGMSTTHPDHVAYADAVEKLLPIIFADPDATARVRGSVRLTEARRRSEIVAEMEAQRLAAAKEKERLEAELSEARRITQAEQMRSEILHSLSRAWLDAAAVAAGKRQGGMFAHHHWRSWVDTVGGMPARPTVRLLPGEAVVEGWAARGRGAVSVRLFALGETMAEEAEMEVVERPDVARALGIRGETRLGFRGQFRRLRPGRIEFVLRLDAEGLVTCVPAAHAEVAMHH